VRVIGPVWASMPKGLAGHAGTRPNVGFRPGRPQKPDGMRMEPPPSVPSASGTMPVPSAAALPPLEPPAVLDVSHGLRVTPSSGESVTPFQPNSGVVVLPGSTAPWRRSAATAGASASHALSGLTVRDPRSVGQPRVSRTSFTATGTPSRAPCGSPRAQRASDAAASVRARSASTRRKAFTAGSWRSIAASDASSASTGDSVRARKLSSSDVASGIAGTRRSVGASAGARGSP
jgi:hypothetical protein